MARRVRDLFAADGGAYSLAIFRVVLFATILRLTQKIASE